jgi:O-antigen/teichoic acid export membrane protein
MRAAKRITKNTFYVFLAQFMIKLLHVVFIIYSARLLGAKLYGIFVLVNTMVFICSTFTNLGIRAMIVRKISKDKSNSESFLSNILTLRLCLATLIYLLLTLFVNLYGYPQEIRTLVYIAGIVIIVKIFTESFDTIFISHEKMKTWGMFTLLSTLSFTVLAIIVLALGFGLKVVFLINVIVAAIFAVIFGRYIWKHLFRFKLRFDSQLIKDILIQSIPFFAALLMITLNTKIDIIMLSMISGPVEGSEAIGYYGPAHNILLALMIFPRSLNIALLPVVSQKIYSDNQSVRIAIEKATKLIMITISFPIILATSFFSHEIVALIFGVKYIHSADALMILGWAYAFFALNLPTHSVLGSSKELNLFLPILLGVLLLNIGLNYFLIPKYSFIGAAIATCIVLFINFIGRFYFMRKILEVGISEIKEYLKLLVVLLISVGCVFIIKSFVPWYTLLVLTIIIYLFLLYISSAVKKEEINFFVDWIATKFKTYGAHTG